MKKTLVILLAAALLTLVSCTEKTDTKESTDPVSVEQIATASTPATVASSGKLYIFDGFKELTELELYENGNVKSRKSYTQTGTLLTHTEYGYSDGYSVAEKTSDGKVSKTRLYSPDGKLIYQDVYTEKGRDRWENIDGLAVKHMINADGKKTESTAYKGDAAYPTVAVENEKLYNLIYHENEQVEIRNEYENGKQKMSYLYTNDGTLVNTKSYVYNEAGKLARVDQASPDGEIELQMYYTYNEKGSYASIETKKGELTSGKTEYSYDKYGNLSEWRIYKYDEAGKATEYEKWVITDDGKVLEGTYKVEE